MNAASDCHEIPGCPNLLIDAFRGHYLSSKSKDASNVFILTHYHGDHYGNLPRENKYAGPAVIHCTPVTAALLRHVHQVPHHLVCQHRYGETWDVVGEKKGGGNPNDGAVRATFFDANHCPGAAMVLVEGPPTQNQSRNSKGNRAAVVHHLHTGDFRYHPRMQTYTLLREAVINRTLDCLFLDTTFAHPRHAFEPQAAAIESIASQAHDLLSSPSTDTLVLLSCYSIGKERVLWEVSARTQQLVHVSETKLQKLQCLTEHEDDGDENDDVGSEAVPQPQHCHRMVDRCTTDPSKSDVHVVPMGLAGEMWPYFQPNFGGCYEYAAKLDKPYRRIVTFIPTGWAMGSKWNREHSLSRQTYKGVEVEVRLVAYSEHSSFDELQEFVAYCRPRKVVPTVFSGDKDLRRIQSLFPVDTLRAKQHFFHSFTAAAVSGQRTTPMANAAEATSVDNKAEEASPPPERETNAILNGRKRKDAPNSRPAVNEVDASQQLVTMGFALDDCQDALTACKGNVERAVEWLLKVNSPSSVVVSELGPSSAIAEPSKAPCTPPQTSTGSGLTASEETTPGPSKRPQKTLLSYFGRKS
jgi:DNA cross-link repair 1A protein